jgi:hypothetical protein
MQRIEYERSFGSFWGGMEASFRFPHYVLSGGKIIFKNDETGETMVLDYGKAK